MGFYEVLDQVVQLLRQRGRVTYRALKREFQLDDAFLEDLKDELIAAQRLAIDEQGTVLVWTGKADPTSTPQSAPSEPHAVAITAAAVPVGPQLAAPTAPPPDGERRQLTVLFCDLVGSTALSTQLDPEVLRELVRAYQVAAAEAIERYEGHIAQYLGDGLLVYFGYPRAHEDDAQRAVRAGLGIVQALAQLNVGLAAERNVRLDVRVGIHTGLVVVGEMGGGARREHLAMGEVPNIAARLQTLAEPGAVVISGQTQRLVHGYFDMRALGLQQLKSLADAVSVHQVLRPNRWRSRVDVAAERGLSPFTGRVRELETLLDRFAQARAGQSQIVFVHGEPGIGKSRLLYECKRRLEGEDLTWLEGRCISYGQSIPYLPLVELLKANFRIDEADSEDAIAAKLEHGVGALGAALLAGLPYLKHLLAVDPGDASVATLDPQVRKAQTFEALRALAVAGAAVRPLVLVVEDIHWIDRLSEEWLSYLAETVQDSRLLVVLTYRPDYEFRFGTRPSFTHLALHSLSAGESEVIARGLLDAAALPQELQELIARKAEGNPLFVEEVTKSLAEAGAIARDGTGYVLARPVDALEVPNTVQDVIMARLDRLAGEPKRAIQTASVIGREFTVRLLERTAELHGRVEEYLRELKALELIYERSLYPELAYMFKHALTHDVAYNSLLLARRKVLHRLVGDAIEALYADRLVEHYETLAYHYERAEAWTKAIDYLRKSGEKALAAHAYPEALASFQRALQAKGAGQDDLQTAALLWGLGRSQAALYDFRAAVGNISRAFDVYVAHHDLAGAIAVAQYPWPPVPSLLGGVAELIEQALPLVPDNSLEAARMLIPYATALYMTKFDYAAARRAFMRAEDLASSHGDCLLQVHVLAAAAGVDMYAARFAQGSQRGRRALALAQQAGDLLGIAASAWAAGACLLYGGDLEQGERCIQAGIEPAERLKGRTHIARLYLHAASIAWLRGDLDAARRFCERGLAAAPRESRLVSCLAVIEGAAGNLSQAYTYVDGLLAAWREAGAADLNMASNGMRAGMWLALITQDEDRASSYAHVASHVLAAPDAPELYRWFMRTALGVSAVVRCDLAAASEHYLQLRAAAAGLCAWFWTGDRLLGLLARTMAESQAAASHFEDALAFCRRGGYRPEYAWTCLDYAELLLAVGGRWSGTGHGGWAAIPLSQASASQDAGETQAVGDARTEDQARARVLLNEGLQIAQELGLRPLQERILSHNELLQA